MKDGKYFIYCFIEVCQLQKKNGESRTGGYRFKVKLEQFKGVLMVRFQNIGW